MMESIKRGIAALVFGALLVIGAYTELSHIADVDRYLLPEQPPQAAQQINGLLDTLSSYLPQR